MDCISKYLKDPETSLHDFNRDKLELESLQKQLTKKYLAFTDKYPLKDPDLQFAFCVNDTLQLFPTGEI